MVPVYLLELLQTFRNVERDVDERPVRLILKNRASFRLKVQPEDGSNTRSEHFCHLDLIVLEKNIGLEIIDGLVDDVRVDP